jgi:TolB protein
MAVILVVTACSSADQLAPLEPPDVAIFLMGRDGTGVRELIAGSDPAWSPDGGSIAFAGADDLGNVDIYVLDARGGEAVRLSDAPGRDSVPTWSPDGRRIAFTSWRDGNGEIYVMNSDGSGQARLTQTPWPETHPAWSPDGSRIAFDGGRIGERDIYLMDPTGGYVKRVVERSGDQWFPAWSPEGRMIVYGDATDGRIHMGVLDPHGGLGLGVSIADGYAPRWSPGERILFLHAGDLFSIRPSGLRLRRLTATPEQEATGDWAPDGGPIAFARVGG